MKATSFLISSWPKRMARSISSSGTSFAPASTMSTASRVPLTVRCSVLLSRWAASGQRTSSPSTQPTTTVPVGPPQGMSLTDSAAEDPIIAGTSGGMSLSTLRQVATTCTSLRMPLGNSGRSGRSIRRQVSVAFSVGRPSRLMKPPGILPTEYCFSSKSTLSGKKSTPSRAFSLMVALTITTVSP